ncbi:phosphatidylinositol-4,5-diphosphate 3-kinase [Pelomyxa schiedti]|nr:phosphatidylinositol-4,5-diphosphate 3-kinase [Pelomyxa schiedti]
MSGLSPNSSAKDSPTPLKTAQVQESSLLATPANTTSDISTTNPPCEPNSTPNTEATSSKPPLKPAPAIPVSSKPKPTSPDNSSEQSIATGEASLSTPITISPSPPLETTSSSCSTDSTVSQGTEENAVNSEAARKKHLSTRSPNPVTVWKYQPQQRSHRHAIILSNSAAAALSEASPGTPTSLEPEVPRSSIPPTRPPPPTPHARANSSPETPQESSPATSSLQDSGVSSQGQLASQDVECVRITTQPENPQQSSPRSVPAPANSEQRPRMASVASQLTTTSSTGALNVTPHRRPQPPVSAASCASLQVNVSRAVHNALSVPPSESLPIGRQGADEQQRARKGSTVEIRKGGDESPILPSSVKKGANFCGLAITSPDNKLKLPDRNNPRKVPETTDPKRKLTNSKSSAPTNSEPARPPGANLLASQLRSAVGESFILRQKMVATDQGEDDPEISHTLATKSINIVYKGTVPPQYFYYHSTISVQSVVANVARDAHLPPGKKLHLGIPDIGIWLGDEFLTQPLMQLPFVQVCCKLGICFLFEVSELPMDTKIIHDIEPLTLSLIAEMYIFDLVDSRYSVLIGKHKEEVDHERRVLARMRLAMDSTLRAELPKFVYVGSEPALEYPSAVTDFTVTCSLVTDPILISCPGDTPITMVTAQVFNAFQFRAPEQFSSLSASRFTLKAHGYHEFLEDIDPSHPLVLCDFDCVRRAVLKSQPLQFTFMERRVLLTTPTIDLNETIDKLLAREPILSPTELSKPTVSILDIQKVFSLKICSVENIKWPVLPDEKPRAPPFKVYVIAGIFHCGACIAPPVFTTVAQYPLPTDFTAWDTWLHFNITLRCLPKESRLLFTIFATVDEAHIGQTPTEVGNKDTPLGWAGMHLFNHKSVLKSGKLKYKLWEGSANPIGVCVENTGNNATILNIEFEKYPSKIIFPLPELFDSALSSPPTTTLRFGEKEKAQLKTIDNLDPLLPLTEEDKDFLWEFREMLMKLKPRALPKLMRCVRWHIPEHASEAHRILKLWPLLKPTAALELLDARFADEQVRQFAIKCINTMSDPQLSSLLLQLTQVLKYEPHHGSDLSHFLLHRALKNKTVVGHMLFWYLKSEMHVDTISERYGILIEAFLRGSGIYRQEFLKEHKLLQALENVARHVKTLPKEDRIREARELLAKIPFTGPVQLPLDPRFVVQGFIIEKCKVMDSKKVPLWLVFRNSEQTAPPILVIFKTGDDLRQDILTLQMLRLMDSMWKNSGLDLRLQPYRCVATGDNIGMIEVVLNAATNAAINRDRGGTVAIMSNDTLSLWLREHNPNDLEYGSAVINFMLSCAGYCVATYILGIGDRHADNVMITKNGLFFHIDFGHFLGNMKSKFGVKRERAPFKFTPQYAYILGGREGSDFHQFEELCGRAYNILRTDTSLFITLFSLMLSTGIPELQTESDLEYLRKALCVGDDNVAAAERFKKLITKSLNAKSQTLNDIAHGLAHR